MFKVQQRHHHSLFYKILICYTNRYNFLLFIIKIAIFSIRCEEGYGVQIGNEWFKEIVTFCDTNNEWTNDNVNCVPVTGDNQQESKDSQKMGKLYCSCSCLFLHAPLIALS